MLRSATSFTGLRQDRDVTALAAFENAISEKTMARDHGHPRHVDLAFGAAWLRGAPRQKSARRVPNVGHRIPPKWRELMLSVTDKGPVRSGDKCNLHTMLPGHDISIVFGDKEIVAEGNGSDLERERCLPRGADAYSAAPVMLAAHIGMMRSIGSSDANGSFMRCDDNPAGQRTSPSRRR